MGKQTREAGQEAAYARNKYACVVPQCTDPLDTGHLSHVNAKKSIQGYHTAKWARPNHVQIDDHHWKTAPNPKHNTPQEPE